ncbi:MAG: hypothetical protein ACTHWO_08440 [Nesterenkonia sp.]
MTERPPDDGDDRDSDDAPDTHRPDPHQRWSRDHGADVPRTASGALPLRIIIIVILIFAAGFYLYRRWRQQYVTYGVDSSGEISAVLAAVGLG